MVSTGWRTGRDHQIAIPGRGRLAVRDSGGPPGAPALVLLHGVTLTADLNWAAVVPALSAHFRVLSLDLPGHGRGLRPPGRFRLEDCADDIAAVAGTLGIGRLIPVGYSMGGLIAQLLWRRHPDRTAGLVLCATARNVSGSLWESSVALMMPGVLATAAWVPPLWPLRADVVGRTLLDGVPDPATRRWALEQMRRTSLLEALSAVDAASRFTSHRWIGTVDVPTAVVVTGRDRVVPPGRQHKLAAAVPGCLVHELDAGHGAFIGSPAAFAATLLRACTSVVEQAAGGRAESAS